LAPPHITILTSNHHQYFGTYLELIGT